jgi:hypothetical protein
MYSACSVEMKLILRIFYVVRSSVCVDTSPSLLMRFPPYVNLVRSGSAFCGRTSQTNMP